LIYRSFYFLEQLKVLKSAVSEPFSQIWHDMAIVLLRLSASGGKSRFLAYLSNVLPERELVAALDGHKVRHCIYRGILCMALKIKLLDKLNQKLCQLQKKSWVVR
jgi:hypothetical protein